MKIQTSQESGKGGYDRPHISEGIKEAKLKEVKEISEGQYGPRVAFIFEVNEEGKAVELAYVAYVPSVATSDNKFGKAIEALGVELGKEVDTEALKDKEAKVLVEDYEYEEDGNKKVGSTISKVKPIAEVKKVE